jgi:hypothetical protein
MFARNTGIRPALVEMADGVFKYNFSYIGIFQNAHKIFVYI